MGTKVKLTGFKELEKSLSELKKSTGSGVLRRAGAKAMQPMADLASRLAANDPETPPVDLQTSVTLSVKARTGRGGMEDIEKGTRATIHMGPAFDLPRYARALVNEFGSYKMAAQPFMRPAFEQDASGVIERLKPLIRAEIDKTVARAAARAARIGRG